MFIPNHDKTALVNVAHIITVSISEPSLERKDYWLVAGLTYGTQILFKGSKDDCITEMQHIYKTC